MRIVALILVLGAGAGATFALSSSAADSKTRTVTLRQGDVVVAPGAKTRCVASQEGGAPNLFCTRTAGGPYQFVFYADDVIVWNTRKGPDRPAATFAWAKRR